MFRADKDHGHRGDTGFKQWQEQSVPKYSPVLAVATTPVSTRMAATDVPNSAPMVPAAATMTTNSMTTLGHKRLIIATKSAVLIAITANYGQRPTPLSSPKMVTITMPGTREVFMGGATNSTVAESRPPCPETKVTIRPMAIPIRLTTPKIHHRESSGTFNAYGR